MEAFRLHVGTSGWSLMIQDIYVVILVTEVDSLLTGNSLKYIKLEVAEQKSTVLVS